MFRLSNNLIGILNIATFLLSVPVLGAGIWLANRADTDCEKFLEKPVIALGVFLMAVSIAGLVGACCRVSWLLWLYLLVMFLLILLLFAFTVFTFVVTNKGAGKAVSGKGYKEYKLGDYSDWLQKRVNGTKNWNKIKSCLIDSKVCNAYAEKYSKDTVVNDFYNEHLSALQSGCCKPPDSCNFTYVSPLVWTASSTTTYTDSDCNAWSNNSTVLCYNCQSCKAGLLDNLKGDWKKVAIVNVIILVVLIVVYSVGCSAFRNSREDNAFWKGRNP
ncbi:tetraspanin-8-like [Rhodamnia argentea]|uniref:Tetraspanin-8-like n=1 Tax=Rhodamnia argentea TaxID=178133 RepID=A0ABM3HC66_9MYRT|nr:tetraspanin-8-like [Rhodamnia argentea]